MSESIRPPESDGERPRLSPTEYLFMWTGKILLSYRPDNPFNQALKARRTAIELEKKQARFGEIVESRMETIGGFVSVSKLCEPEIEGLESMGSHEVRQGLRWLYDNNRIIRMIKPENDERCLFITKDKDGVDFNQYPNEPLARLAKMPNGYYVIDFKPHEYYALISNDPAINSSLLLDKFDEIHGPSI